MRPEGAKKNKGMGARAKRVQAMIKLRRRQGPIASSSTPPAAAPAAAVGGTVATRRLAPEFEPELEPVSSSSTHHRISMLSIRTNVSSLSYSRLSGITLPPSPNLYTPVSERDEEDGAEDDGGAESESDETISELYPPDSPISDSGSTSTAPSSLWSEKDPAQRPLSPYQCVFDFPDVPTGRPRFLTPKAHQPTRSISTPSLQTVYEGTPTASFVGLS